MTYISLDPIATEEISPIICENCGSQNTEYTSTQVIAEPEGDLIEVIHYKCKCCKRKF